MPARLLLTLAIAVLLAVPAPLAAQEPELRVNTSIKPPLSTREQDGALDVLVKELFDRVGRAVRLVRLPAERAMRSVNEGTSDAELPRVAGLEKKYPNLVMVPERIIDYAFVGFTRDPDVAVQRWEDLVRYDVGAITGWKIYEKNVPAEADTLWVRNIDRLFSLLGRGRVEVALHERYAGGHVARTLGLQGVRELEPPLAVRPMYLYVHDSHRDLVPGLAAALRAMKADGTWERIVREAVGR